VLESVVTDEAGGTIIENRDVTFVALSFTDGINGRWGEMHIHSFPLFSVFFVC
jgi:hypothetical protein